MNNCSWQPGDRHTILGLWREAVAKAPDTVFLHFIEGDEKYTYGDFEKLTNRLAQGLLAAGITPGDPVATLLDNHVDSVALLFVACKVNAHLCAHQYGQ